MLTFGTNLTNSYKAKQAAPIWLLHLYHGAGSSYVALAEEDITVNGVDYLGIVQSWGMLNQKADIVVFEASFAKVTINIDNTIDAAVGSRFTDLYSSKQFSNRKWELYASDGVSVSTDSIGSGLISDDIRANDESVTMYLLGYESKYNDKIPTNVVDASTYPNAPKRNIDKPIPMAYGDFDRETATTGVNHDRIFVKGYFPAIITDEGDIDAKPDNETLEMIRVRNLYMRLGNHYAACAPGNVTAPGADGTGSLFTFTGASWFIYAPLTKVITSVSSTNPENLIDLDLSTTGILQSNNVGGQYTEDHIFSLAVIEVAGVFINFHVHLDKTAIAGGNDPSIAVGYNDANYVEGENPLTANDESITANTARFPRPGDQLGIRIHDIDVISQVSVTFAEIACEIEVAPTITFVHSIKSIWERRRIVTPGKWYPYWIPGIKRYVPASAVIKSVLRNIDIFAPANIEYIYYAGQGRQYGASIDTIDGNARNTENGSGSDPGYASGDLIKNPIYQVEEMLRTEAGLDSGVTGIEIDIESFDVAGALADGLIGNVFNDAVGDVDFAFSQYQFTDAFSFMEKVGRQCGTLFFISGSSKIKARVRQRPSDYDAGEENMKIDYDDLYDIEWYFSPTNEVRNDVTVKYNFDYAREETTESDNSADATSKGSGTSGYNETLILEEIANCIIDDTTAAALGDYLLAILKDRHIMFKFSTNNPRYQALEIGDVITFRYWDSNVKVYGAAPDANDLFMVVETSKIGPNKTIIEVMEVSAPG